jgi:hypothetical protein
LYLKELIVTPCIRKIIDLTTPAMPCPFLSISIDHHSPPSLYPIPQTLPPVALQALLADYTRQLCAPSLPLQQTTYRLQKHAREHRRNKHPLNRIQIHPPLALIQLCVNRSVGRDATVIGRPVCGIVDICRSRVRVK